MDTLISRQLYLRLRFQFPIFLPSQTLYLHIPVSGLHTLSRKWKQTLLDFALFFALSCNWTPQV